MATALRTVVHLVFCIVAALVLFVGGGLLYEGLHTRSDGTIHFSLHCPMYRYPCRGYKGSAYLKTLAVAQNDFRVNDRDENGIQDFWRKDVAGLYTVKSSGQPNKLIELSVAAADDRPASKEIESFGVRGPKGGYWYRAIPHAGEKTPEPDRFAYCCFPADYPRSGKLTYILDEKHVMYKRDLGRPGGIEVFPEPAELERDWTRMR